MTQANSNALSNSMSFADAAKVLGCHLGTVWRYSSTGVRGVKLESWLIGGKRVTSADSIESFLRALNGEKQDPPPSPADSIAEKMKRSLEAANT